MDALQKLLDGLAFLESHQVLIGIPEAEASSRGSINNVELAFIMTNGSPLKGIPPRPFLEPGIASSEAKGQIAREMGNAVKQAIEGNLSGARASLEKAGLIGQSAVQTNMGGIPPPNKPETIRRKGSSVTLIDTGSLRQAITYVVEGD